MSLIQSTAALGLCTHFELSNRSEKMHLFFFFLPLLIRPSWTYFSSHFFGCISPWPLISFARLALLLFYCLSFSTHIPGPVPFYLQAISYIIYTFPFWVFFFGSLLTIKLPCPKSSARNISRGSRRPYRAVVFTALPYHSIIYMYNTYISALDSCVITAHTINENT
jgi:hypothetical protein